MKAKYTLCKICNTPISGRGFWKHKYKEHNNLTDIEFLLKQLDLTEVPKCSNPNCNNLCVINYNTNKFTSYCSRTCLSRSNMNKLQSNESYIKKMKEVRSNNMTELNKKNWSNPEFIDKMNKLFTSKEFLESARNKFIDMNLKHWSDSEFRAKMSSVARSNMIKFRKVRTSKVELILFNKIHKIFKSAINSYKINGYVLDIFIPELNLGVEIDGACWHDINKDIIRDRCITNSLKCNIRRLDSIAAYHMELNELIYALLNESIQKIPYFDRLPIELIPVWKYNPYIVVNNYQLTYK